MKKAIFGIFLIFFVFSINGKVNSAINDGKTLGKQPEEQSSELLQLTAGGHILGFKRGAVYIASGSHMLHTVFVKSNSVAPFSCGEEHKQGNAPLELVMYENLWDGVDVEYRPADSGVVKSTYYVESGEAMEAGLESIRLKYNVPVEIDKSGEMVFSYRTGRLRESKPVAWQLIDGERKYVDISYKKTGEKEVGFETGNVDKGYRLVIDPVLQWSTFLGDLSSDRGQDIALDNSGNVYVAGYSSNSWGSPVSAYTGAADAFVAKLNSSGTLQWHTFLGSGSGDIARGITVDGSGNVYVAGYSSSSWGSPVSAHTGAADAFVAKLNSSGILLWNTFLGGSLEDESQDIAVDSSGNVYVTGWSYGTWGSPVRAYSGNDDAFAAELDENGNLQWHSFLGSTNADSGRGIAVDSSGNVYVAGSSSDTWGSPVRAYSGNDDAFAAELDGSGNLQWNTFLGGSASNELGRGIAVDGDGNVYVTGESSGSWGSPVRMFSDMRDAFAAKLNSTGNLQWNTFLGGVDIEIGRDIEVDSSGNVYVAGRSDAAWGSPIRAFSGGGRDAFAAELNGTGNLQWNTFLGGGAYDDGQGAAVINSGTLYVAGWSNYPWGSPVRPYSGHYDIFVAELAPYFITGAVTEDGLGLSGVTITGLVNPPVTSGDGSYQGKAYPGWSGTATPVLTGYNFIPSYREYDNVNADQASQDYNALLITYQISGTVTENGVGLSGVSIDGLPTSPVTETDGTYSDTVDHGWSGTGIPALTGYTFTPSHIDYINVTSNQTDQDYTASLISLNISGTVTKNGSGVSGVVLNGLPSSPVTAVGGAYGDTVNYGWSGTVTPSYPGYTFDPEYRDYTNITYDQTNQDYTAFGGYYSSPSSYQVIPEVLWAPATGGGTWMTEVQITDVTGGSDVSVYFNSAAGDRRGPIGLFTGSGPDTTVKTGNLLKTLDQLDPGFDYDGQVGAVEFMTQDADNKIHVIAKTKNGNYSKTFPGLNHNDDNTASGGRVMMIQNLANNDICRTAYGGFNTKNEPITVEFELIAGDGSTIGAPFTKTFDAYQYLPVSVFNEAGVPYPTYSFDNVWLKIYPLYGDGELISYGATANNVTNDPAVHIAAQAADIGGYNSPSNYQVIPEVLWAPATGGGTWMTEVQITDITGGSEISVYYNTSAGDRRGPIDLFTGSGPGVSGRAANLLAVLDALDSGFDYYSTVGTVEFVTQDADHKIQVMGRTANGNYSKTFQGLNLNDANTASSDRTLMVQNLVNNDTYRTAFGGFNPTDNDVTVEFTLMDENGSTIGTSFSKTFTGRQYQAFNPFTEAGVPYPGNSYNNTWIKVDVTSGSGQLMVYGATANNITSDPAVHRAVQH